MAVSLACVVAVRRAVAVGVVCLVSAAQAADCRGSVYLTLDTGNMSHAEEIAAILRKHDAKATFLLAKEKTTRGDGALDASWADYWKARAAEGHSFGTHTLRHGRFLSDAPDGAVVYRPQFGAGAGQRVTLDAKAVCNELRAVGERFTAATAQPLDALWRAPGGYTTKHALEAARTCGFAHVHWAPAGFLGDELPSERYPNRVLLERALRDIRDGDVVMAHLGIWSRKDPFAPMLDPLVAGLKQRGFCLRTLKEHPQYNATVVPTELAAHRGG